MSQTDFASVLYEWGPAGSEKSVLIKKISPPLQFKKSPPKVPYKAIALATVLFLIGSLLIIIGALLLAGYFEVTVSISPGTVFLSFSTSNISVLIQYMSEISPPHSTQTELCLSLSSGSLSSCLGFTTCG